jgi:hypothetical protein
MRVKLFIDFWNFQLSWNEHHQRRGAKDEAIGSFDRFFRVRGREG